jgi:xanthine dehydrogenase YagS FAD-binding subunit
MMNFSYSRVSSAREAVELLGDGARLVVGGTDLVPLMKDEIEAPRALVDLSGWGDGARIWSADDGLHIGALAPVSAVGAHPDVLGNYRALAEACRLAATPQLRNMGTIGGNLLQQTRCWYYRGPHECWLKGGDTCFARAGENEYHSIFFTDPEASPCVSAHPSDPAVALLSLGARVKYLSRQGASEIPIEELYAMPTKERRAFTTLPGDVVLTEVVLPVSEGASVFRKGMARAAWSFALASVAIYVKLDGLRIAEARVALGGVAPTPIRALDAEKRLVGSKRAELDLHILADDVVLGARPLAHNGYKVQVLRGLVAEALQEIGIGG